MNIQLVISEIGLWNCRSSDALFPLPPSFSSSLHLQLLNAMTTTTFVGSVGGGREWGDSTLEHASCAEYELMNLSNNKKQA